MARQKRGGAPKRGAQEKGDSLRGAAGDLLDLLRGRVRIGANQPAHLRNAAWDVHVSSVWEEKANADTMRVTVSALALRGWPARLDDIELVFTSDAAPSRQSCRFDARGQAAVTLAAGWASVQARPRAAAPILPFAGLAWAAEGRVPLPRVQVKTYRLADGSLVSVEAGMAANGEPFVSAYGESPVLARASLLVVVDGQERGLLPFAERQPGWYAVSKGELKPSEKQTEIRVIDHDGNEIPLQPAGDAGRDR